MANIKVHTHTRVIGSDGEESAPLAVTFRDGKEKALIEFTSDTEATINAAVPDAGDTVEFELYRLLDTAARLARARSEQTDRQRGIVRPVSEVDGESIPVRVNVAGLKKKGRNAAA